MPQDPVTTDRLILAPLTVADADDMVEVLADDELYGFIGGEALSLAQLRARYERLVVGGSADGTQEWHNWIIRRAEDRQAVGYVQATVTEAGRHAEVAWVVGLAWQRRGYAGEAAEALVEWLRDRGVVQITAHVHPEHVASGRVAERIGLKPTEQFEDGERLWDSGSPVTG